MRCRSVLQMQQGVLKQEPNEVSGRALHGVAVRQRSELSPVWLAGWRVKCHDALNNDVSRSVA